ncbi:hypothetical protein BGX38DRAFT_1271357 [Terfezia claveryi]|nr:hypothetical protein BGX38DRAFT_1271357 [Terfezia claveryi]
MPLFLTHSSPTSLVPASRAGPNAQTTSQNLRATYVLQLQKFGKRTQIPPLSKVDSEGPDVAKDNYINTPGNSNWQLPPESEDQPFLMAKRDRIGVMRGSNLEVLHDEKADGSDDEQGDYIAKEEAVQYAKITLGEEIM